jgi:hypothetical protein
MNSGLSLLDIIEQSRTLTSFSRGVRVLFCGGWNGNQNPVLPCVNSDKTQPFAAEQPPCILE